MSSLFPRARDLRFFSLRVRMGLHLTGDSMSELAYTYTHVRTEATTGYFACVPEAFSAERPEDTAAGGALAALEACPADAFLHDFLLQRLLGMDMPALCRLLPADPLRRPVLSALVAEAALLFTETGGDMPAGLPPRVLSALLRETDFTLLAWGLRASRQETARLNRAIRDNITLHRPMAETPADWGAGIKAAAKQAAGTGNMQTPPAKTAAPPSLAHVRAGFVPPPKKPRPPLAETASLALERLLDAGALIGPEYRHASSLAPVALFRNWPIELRVRDQRVRHTLSGTATSWGRGFSIAEARVSCVMEMIERLSAYISVIDGEITGRLSPCPLIKASFAELTEQGREAVDPNLLPLGLPYRGQRVWWMQAEYADGSPVLAPVQAAALFCNLDEPSLLLPPISTGLAAGNTVEEARRAALLEVLERDAEAVTPWRGDDVFCLAADDPAVAALLAAFAQRRVAVLFRELKTPFGVPCYEAFVTGEDGQIARATAAGLNGRRAILSALTEVPWPFPDSPPTAPAPPGTPVRKWEALPDFSTGSAAGDTALLERLLAAHGRRPVYAALTRSDLLFPVVRALVPGLVSTADSDAWTNPPARVRERFRPNGANVC